VECCRVVSFSSSIDRSHLGPLALLAAAHGLPAPVVVRFAVAELAASAAAAAAAAAARPPLIPLIIPSPVVALRGTLIVPFASEMGPAENGFDFRNYQARV